MPDPTNSDRARWADNALRAFQASTRTDDEDALTDLLCDLMHFADRNFTRFGSWDDALRRAQNNYLAELNDEET